MSSLSPQSISQSPASPTPQMCLENSQAQMLHAEGCCSPILWMKKLRLGEVM